MQDFFSGLGGGLILLVVAAIGRQWNKYRTGKTSSELSTDTRLTSVETSVKTLNDGLFGAETPFGRTGGFVQEVRMGMKELTAAIKERNGE